MWQYKGDLKGQVDSSPLGQTSSSRAYQGHLDEQLVLPEIEVTIHSLNVLIAASSRGEAPYPTTRPLAPRSTKSREYFTGAFAGSSALSSGSSPPDKDLWGSATKKGSFDENGKFVVAEDDQNAQTIEDKEKDVLDVATEDLQAKFCSRND